MRQFFISKETISRSATIAGGSQLSRDVAKVLIECALTNCNPIGLNFLPNYVNFISEPKCVLCLSVRLSSGLSEMLSSRTKSEG